RSDSFPISSWWPVPITRKWAGWGAKRLIRELFRGAGIEIGGSQPWDVRVQDDRFYERALAQGNLGLGESYMEGRWDCGRLDELVCRLLKHGVGRRARRHWATVALSARAKLTNMQTVDRATKVALQHYDLGNDFFSHMLDSRMIYSCAYWKDAKDLEQAQK